MAVNHQEPEFISSEVDHVASTMVDTERTMNELPFATGLNTLDNEPHLERLSEQLHEALFSREIIYEVLLWESPSLRKTMKWFSRLPELPMLLLIYTNQRDDDLLLDVADAAEKLKR
jgi:hypothetical protein